MGKYAKDVGTDFQQDFAKSISDLLYYEKYRDATPSFGDGKNKFKKHLPNAGDFWINDGRFVLIVETKTTKENRLPYSNFQGTQLWKMIEAVTKHKTHGGVFVNFRSINETYFLLIEDLLYWFYFVRGNVKSGSIPLNYIQSHGYLVASRLIRTRFKYGVLGVLHWVYTTKEAFDE